MTPLTRPWRLIWTVLTAAALAILTVALPTGVVAEEGGTLLTLSDGGVPTTQLFLSPQSQAGDDAAFVEFQLEGVAGAESTAGALAALNEMGIGVGLFCPDAVGNAGLPIAFEQNVVCEIDVGGAWVPTPDRVVVITGVVGADEPEAADVEIKWSIHRLLDPDPIPVWDICRIDPRACYAVKDIGMTQHRR